ncbi:MAG TPA: YhcH/YjgK/YiaL family protein [Serratia grimesii]|uniref:YhcH/YjgK/YiaL family protein n=1 Tax=Serratia grimesii TaxID=82995 RepID=A0A9C7QYP1_9GAMM|nr:YhcH/YjgK/YiaL family protein [Serratia grimesii]HCK02573.1 YhcH/YjgK/YiaL family protein [Serratia grimesii]
MIYNTLFNPRYGRGLSPVLIETLTTLRQYDLPALALGHHDIDGDQIFMEVLTLTTGLAETQHAKLHHEYADIHLLISGEERIDYGMPGDWQSEFPYDEAQDTQRVDIKRHCQTLAMFPGAYALFFPHEPHKAGCQLNAPTLIKKAVVRVHYTLLL